MQGNSVTIATSAEQIAVCEAIADWADARDTTGWSAPSSTIRPTAGGPLA